MQVVVGRVGRPHGISGEVTVEVRTDDPEGRLPPGATLQTEPAAAGPLTITRGRVHGGRLLLAFDGVTDRGAAERLRGVLLVADVDPEERPEDPEEYYDRQLVGLRVETVSGRVVGELAEVLHLPGHDVLSVRRPEGDEVLVPFVAAIVPTVDVDAGRVLVDPPPGLIDDADDEPGA
ncbi:MAG: ribosome maturation factor RimM [Actinomycetes bacterium]